MNPPADQTDHRRNYELAAINEIARALSHTVDPHAALRTALEQVARLFDLETGWVWLINQQTGESYLAAAQNLPPALAGNPARMEGSCYCLDSFQAGDLEGAANVSVITCTRLKNLVDGTDGLRYHASVPLYAQDGSRLGVFNVASRDWRELSPHDLRLLYTVGDLLSLAVERALLFAKSVDLGAANERNRLAREIHDTLAQGLAAIALQLETADALLDAQPEAGQVRAAVQSALRLARENLEEARRSVLDLRAKPLEGRTLAQAIQDLASSLEGQTATTVTVELVGEHRPLPPAVEAGLYRIAQEALNNVQCHAQADHALIRLVTTPDKVQLSIEDDGCGFDPAQVTPNRYGLTGMNERVRLLGGTLEIAGRPGVGVKVIVTAPTPRRSPSLAQA